MKVLCGYIAIFTCVLVAVSATNSSCPPEAPSGCSCERKSNGLQVKCTYERGMTAIPSWLPNDTTVLRLDNCSIANLNKDSFKNLVHLTVITIRNWGKRLTFDDRLVFQGLKALYTLRLGTNNITSLPAGLFANLPRLQSVYLSFNPLSRFPDDLFENSTNVRYLLLYKTRLSSDVLAKIGRGDFGTNFAFVGISGTPVERLDDGFFSGLPRLYIILLRNCGIKSIGADVLNGTSANSRLYLDGNPIEHIHRNAFRGSRVIRFNCVGCQLTSNVTFNGFLQKMVPLNQLYLQNNEISFVPKDAFAGLRNLVYLYLSNNSIGTIEENPFTNLSRICFSCLRIHDNPLNCDCNLAWLRSFTENKPISADKWECARPSKVAGKSLSSLKLDEFCCGNITSTGERCAGSLPPNPNNAQTVSCCMFGIISTIMVLLAVSLLHT